MDSIEKAAALIKGITNKTQGAMHSANVTTLTGVAKSDSADGIVQVDLGGTTIGEDDAEQAVEMETTCDVREGDTVQIKVAGADGSAKSLMVDGVVGGGDRTDGKIEKIKAIIRETDEGIEISKPDSEFTTVTTNDSYLIKHNGKIVTKISESEQIYYCEVDGESKPYGKILCKQNNQFRYFKIMGIGSKFAPAIDMSCSDYKSQISIMTDANNPKAGSFGVYTSKFPNGNNGNPVSFLTYNNYNIVNFLHPVGSWYLSDDLTSPAEIFGGTWESITAKDFAEFQITTLLVSGLKSNNGKTISPQSPGDNWEFITHLATYTSGFISTSYVNSPNNLNGQLWVLNPPNDTVGVWVPTLWGKRNQTNVWKRIA